MNLRLAAAAVVMVGALLTGCSEDGDDYCAALAAEQETLGELADKAEGGGQDLVTPLESFERLQAVAPDELQDEWETVVVAYQALVDAVDAAGIDPADYDPDNPAPGVSKADADRVRQVADKVASLRVAEAAGGIQQHAAEVCEVDFAG